MGFLVFASIITLFFLVVGGVLIGDKPKYPFGYVLVAGSIVFFLLDMVAIAPSVFKTGEPMTNIDKGEYHVVFIYTAGDNVSVGVEKSNLENEIQISHLYLYQFSKNAFESPVKPNATTLKVVESGKFRKLILE